MRKVFLYFIFIAFLLNISSEAVFAQINKAVITSKKITYRRKGYKKEDLKEEFTVIYPQVKIPGNQLLKEKSEKN